MTRTIRAPFVALTLALAMLLAFAIPGTAQAQEGLVQQITAPVIDDVTGDAAGEFQGDLEITEITRNGDQLNFVGNIVGDVVDADGDVTDTVDQSFDILADAVTADGNGAACDILNLDLGPLHLDVLGLVVDLSDVQLDITAEPGPGNLLGNLLCSVAGLLDNPGQGGGIGNAIDRLLDRITGLLGG